MSLLRDVIPFILLGVQSYVFLSVESFEIKVALGIVFIFQLCQRSRKGPRELPAEIQEEEKPKAAQRKKKRRQNSE